MGIAEVAVPRQLALLRLARRNQGDTATHCYGGHGASSRRLAIADAVAFRCKLLNRICVCPSSRATIATRSRHQGFSVHHSPVAKLPYLAGSITAVAGRSL
jgi:hypothetical protein